jgi:RNA polymerase sigma-70 factor (ECF subfamily)
MTSGSIDETCLRLALDGDDGALSRMVNGLTPVIQARVARCLLRWRGAGTSIRQQVEDLAQEVLLHLFADGGRILRDWEPGKGLSLENFVGLVAQRRAVSILRTGKRNPWREDSTEDEWLDARSDARPGPEQETIARSTLEELLERLRAELSPLGWQLFELLYVEERGVEEVRAETGLSADAVYAWRSRLRKQARRRLEEIESESAGDSRIPWGEATP